MSELHVYIKATFTYDQFIAAFLEDCKTKTPLQKYVMRAYVNLMVHESRETLLPKILYEREKRRLEGMSDEEVKELIRKIYLDVPETLPDRGWELREYCLECYRYSLWGDEGEEAGETEK